MMDSDNKDLFYIKIFTGFIVLVLFVIILKELKNIFIPFFMALLLYFLFNGVVKKLQKKKIPMVFVLAFLLIFIFIVFYLFGVLIHSGVSAFIDKFPEYSAKFTELTTGLLEKIRRPLGLEENFYLKDALDFSKVTAIVSSTFGDIGSFFGNLVMVLLFLMFMLAGRGGLTGRINKAFKENKSDRIKYVINSIENQVQHYLLIKTFVSFLTALIGGVVLLACGIDFAIFSALLIFVLNFIPNFGSIIATLFPVLIGLLKYGLSARVIFVTAGLMITQFIIGNVVEPKITGKSLDLSPIVILISLIFWGYIWGIVGMMLAVPLTSAIKIIFQYVDVLKPISDLISAE